MPVKYIPYYPNTVEGQAILDNITRTQRVLRYRENDKVYDRIQRGMPYYELELLETVGEPSENLVIRGECISACAYLKEKGIKVDLVYIDPPFASGADYAKKVYIRRNPKLAEKIAKAEMELELEELKGFEEKMYGDIWQKEDYLNWMYENLLAIKSVMSDDSMIFVHLDWHIGHYVKILLDEIFGEDNYRNEIIVNRVKKNIRERELVKTLNAATDSIYLFVQNDEVKILPPTKEEEKDERWHSFEASGYRTGMDYNLFGFKPSSANHWRWQETKAMEAVENFKKWEKGFSEAETLTEYWKRTDEELLFIRSHPKTKKPEYFIPASDETLCDTVWGDISAYSFKNGYATEKSEDLLNRIIEMHPNKEIVVADFFGGGGVTSKASHDLSRKFIHVDIGLNSIQTIRDRLKEANANFQILEIKDGVCLFRNPQQTMDKLATLIPGLQKGVKGISSFWFGAIAKSKEGIVPVYVPNLLNTQEKVLDIPTINIIINQELQNLEVNAKKVIVYYIDIDDQKALEKFIKDNNATEIEVELKDLKNLLHDVVIEDIIEFSTTETKGIFITEIVKLISDRLIQKIGEFNQKGNLQSVAKGKKFTPINISNEGLELIELIALDCKNAEGQWHSATEIKIDKLGYVIKDGVKSKEFWDGKIVSETKPKRIKIRNISGDETVKVIE
ncbi:MAG: site-specific DNA-methyltransferase [Bacteroidota bacterium]